MFLKFELRLIRFSDMIQFLEPVTFQVSIL